MKPHSETHLTEAAIFGNVAFLVLYLKSGGSTNIKDSKGLTALHYACANGHDTFAAILCQFHADLEAPDRSGASPAFYAVRYGDLACIRTLVSFNCDLNHKRSVYYPQVCDRTNGDTCIHEAVRRNRPETITEVAYAGGKLDIRNQHGETALELARKLKAEECCRALVRLERFLVFSRGGARKGTADSSRDTEGHEKGSSVLSAAHTGRFKLCLAEVGEKRRKVKTEEVEERSITAGNKKCWSEEAKAGDERVPQMNISVRDNSGFGNSFFNKTMFSKKPNWLFTKFGDLLSLVQLNRNRDRDSRRRNVPRPQPSASPAACFVPHLAPVAADGTKGPGNNTARLRSRPSSAKMLLPLRSPLRTPWAFRQKALAWERAQTHDFPRRNAIPRCGPEFASQPTPSAQKRISQCRRR